MHPLEKIFREVLDNNPCTVPNRQLSEFEYGKLAGNLEIIDYITARLDEIDGGEYLFVHST